MRRGGWELARIGAWLLVVFAMSACVRMSTGDAVPDGSAADGGASDDGGEWRDAGVEDGGAPRPEDGGCSLVSVTLLSTGDPELNSLAAGISPNGQAIAVNLATLAGSKSAVWFMDGGFIAETGFSDITISAISDSSVAGSVLHSPSINPRQGYRRRFGQPLEVLSDAGFSSDAQGINSRGTTVGVAGFTAAEWHEDGGPGKREPPVTLGAASTEFSAIDDNGLIAGNATTLSNTTFPFTVDAETWRALPCPRVHCRASALGGDHLVGHAGGPVVPVRWTLSTERYEELETRGDLVFGQALAVREDGLTGGVLVFGNSQGPRDGVAALWRQSRLTWLAPYAGSSGIKIVSIVGIASRGLALAGNCYEGDRRVACRVELNCR